LDALYMSVISVTAVGFGEIHPLSDGGRVFTMILLGFSVIGLGLCWAIFAAIFIETDLGGLLERYKMEKKLAETKDHYIICGWGRMGRVIVDEVRNMGFSCVIIEESSEPALASLGNSDNVIVVQGDATKEQTLAKARIDEARGLAACLTDDAENLLLCLTARGMRPDMEIVARAYNEESLDKLRRAGANHAISPTLTGAVRMAATLLRPSVVSFLDAATEGRGLSLRLEEAVIAADSVLVGKTLADARIPQKTGLVVLAMRQQSDESKHAQYNPGPNTILNRGDTMIVLGSEEQIESLRTYVSN